MGRGPALRRAILGAAIAGAFALPSVASAHLERPSYWPDPAPDCDVTPCAGGEVPKPRSLESAVTGTGPGEVRVVCKGQGGEKSLALLVQSLRQAREQGFRLRPSEPRKRISRSKAVKLLRINVGLARQCTYHSVQEAVFDSGNNDRIVMLPGRYTEPKARSEPVNDPACGDMTQLDTSGRAAPSYEYQTECPNDQNLIHIQGRALAGDPPSPPLENREGIPDLGKCVRCNLQLEGSGPKPTDVILDAGKDYASHSIGAKPGDYAKDVILRIDRADGFVGRNFLARGAAEHGVYLEETDGSLLDRVKFYWAAEYGNLTFTSDHTLYRNCDGFGSGDSVVYPGAAPETGEQATDFWPDAPRINTVVKRCDLHGSALAYSGSMGNAVRITHSDIYANTTGISTDAASAGGHPGYPPDSTVIDHNLIYSNNLDLYQEDPPVVDTVGLPIGVGIFYPGVNSARIHDNWIFDNWRRGTMLFAIPEGLERGSPEGQINDGVPCPTAPVLLDSCDNQYFDNHMGVAPPGFKPAKSVHKFGNATGGDSGELPNGVDFWWDEFVGNTGNCWYDNTGPDGTRASLNTDPPLNPLEGTSLPLFLPEDCGTSLGVGDVVKEVVLVACSEYTPGDTAEDHPLCDWFPMPAQPGSPKAKQDQREFNRWARKYKHTDEAAALEKRMRALAGDPDVPTPRELDDAG